MSRCRLRRIAVKAAQLVIKLALIRCFGVEGAAAVLVGFAAAVDRLRAAGPMICKAACTAWLVLTTAQTAVRQFFYDKTKYSAARSD